MIIKNGIVDTAIQMLIPLANEKARPMYPMIAKYIAVHNAGNAGATGKTNAHYVVNQNEYKSWHFTIGNEEIYQHLPINESGWHCGDGEYGKGNRESIGLEIAEVYGAERTAVKFIAELMKATGIGIDKVLPHKYFSGKNCPRLILPHWDKFINDIKQEMGGSTVKYAVTPNRTHELSGDVKDLRVKIVNQSNARITEDNCVNGTFFWNTTNPNEKYSTSILYADGKLYKATANHLPNPQSCLIIYKDNTVDMKRLHNISELDLNNVKIVIGGVGLVNKFDKTFKYDLYGEGFRGAQSDVARRANKTVIGYKKNENKIYLMCRPNIYHQASLQYDLLDLVRDCEYDIALSVDGGGSTFMNANGKNALPGDGRIIHNILYFK